MTKKDYIIIANVLLRTNGLKHKIIIQEFCNAFKKDNPAFNSQLFYKACGITKSDTTA
jgi:hypothetical protein